MKKVFTFLLVALFVTSMFGQRPTGEIMKLPDGVVPVIDGELDDVIWDDANVYDINRPFDSETPTISQGGESNWRALWDNDGMYIFVTVNDNIWFPEYMAPGAPSPGEYAYDKIEIYFDTNFVLDDGGGAMPDGNGGGNGHYQVAPRPETEEMINGEMQEMTNGSKYAYMVNPGGYWTVEVFVPWTHLITSEGVMFDRTAEMGFDITVVDRDNEEDGRQRMVWANSTSPESWENLDDAGRITFDGAEPGTYITSLEITGGEITKNQEQFQVVATIEPADATNKVLKWTIDNAEGQTGQAKISNTGLITPLSNGEITVVAEATDGSYELATAVVTISGQTPSRWRFNVITNGLFEDELNRWGWNNGGIGNDAVISDGAVLLENTEVGADPWSYSFSQSGFQVQQGVPYHFSFTAWGDPRTTRVNFEDPSQDYLRFGESEDPGNVGGRSEWDFTVTDEPTRFEFSVIFNDVVDNTNPAHNYHLGLETGKLYLDSILLITVENLENSVPDDEDIAWNVGVISEDISNLKVFPNPFNNEVFVRNTENIKRVSVTNLVGQRVIDMEVRGDITIDTQQLKGGVYLMIFEGNSGQRIVHKMIKQ